MKRLLTVLGLAALVGTLTGVLFSYWQPRSVSAAADRWVYGDALHWKTHRNGVEFDSTTVTPGAAGEIDTTAAYPVSEFAIPQLVRTAAAVDSITYFGFYLGAATAAPSVDSIYVGTQVSMDGISWVTLTPTANNLLATTIPPIASVTVLESVSGNQFGVIYDLKVAAIPEFITGGFNSATAPTDQEVFGWRSIRWIVTWSAADVGDQLQGYVGHWAN